MGFELEWDIMVQSLMEQSVTSFLFSLFYDWFVYCVWERVYWAQVHHITQNKSDWSKYV